MHPEWADSLSTTLQLADINADGRADYLVISNATGAVTAYLNGGSGEGSFGWLWYPQGQITSGLGGFAGGQYRFADIDGDGRADYIYVDPTSGNVTAWLMNGGDTGIPAATKLANTTN